jgi:hypothetical protein
VDDTPGQDSFLDIVANIVGILIILVMVVGVRAGRVGEGPSGEAGPQPGAAMLDEIRRLSARLVEMVSELRSREVERDQWEMLVRRDERDIEQIRGRLDERSRQRFDQLRQMEQARAELDRLTREQVSLESAADQTITLEHQPTPISRAVEGDEIHFQLRDGRLAFIPLEELLAEFKSVARHKAWRLENQPQLSDSVGPSGGFRLRYRLERFDIPPEVQWETGRGGSVVRLVRWDLIPVSDQLGESIDEALGGGSQLDEVLNRHPPRRASITLWTYPDGFSAVRRLRPHLVERGYLVAVRPLPEGVPIGGSPFGSRSLAQ